MIGRSAGLGTRRASSRTGERAGNASWEVLRSGWRVKQGQRTESLSVSGPRGERATGEGQRLTKGRWWLRACDDEGERAGGGARPKRESYVGAGAGGRRDKGSQGPDGRNEGRDVERGREVREDQSPSERALRFEDARGRGGGRRGWGRARASVGRGQGAGGGGREGTARAGGGRKSRFRADPQTEPRREPLPVPRAALADGS